MKLKNKIIIFTIFVIFLIFFFFIGYYFTLTLSYKIDYKKLEKNSNIVFYDDNLNEISLSKSFKYIEYQDMPKSLINAFVSIEDKRFFSHKGVDYKGIFRALFSNIKSFSLKEGASTITQQLVKNTFLSNEKTFKRKLLEISIAKKIEKKYSKEKILEFYLNSIYFGDSCYGINSASTHYFSKDTNQLTLNECATLAGIVKSPYNYSPTKNIEKSNNRKNLILSEMFNQKYITENEYNDSINKKITLKINEENKNKNFEYFLYEEFDKILDEQNINKNNIKVYTTINQKFQKTIENNLYMFDVSDSMSSIILSKNGEIKGYSSNIGEVNRQLGSILKPVLVYAPAFFYNAVDEVSIIDDNKINIDGFEPRNYNDKYMGKITIKEAISNSSNIGAVKTLNCLTLTKAKKIIKDLPLNLTENDVSLSTALGITEKGATLKQITSSYIPFINNGKFIEPYIIEKIVDNKGKTIYKNNRKSNSVFDEGTSFLINDCLNDCVKNGTSKKIKCINEKLCAKTGTVGNENGNMDAYSICYNHEYISSVWLGNENGKLMNNSVTGGNHPTIINREILKQTFGYNKVEFKMPSEIEEKYLDKISLYSEEKIELAQENFPKRYIINAYFKKNHIPKNISNRFISPKIESVNYSVNIKRFSLSLCVAEYYNYKVYFKENGNNFIIYDSKNNGKKDTIDFEMEENKEYTFYVVPYYNNSFGEEHFIAKIKSPNIISGDWWLS